ncbi:MAG: hypothetical protein AAGK05_17290, partial [Pseudomonadota bacterium]
CKSLTLKPMSEKIFRVFELSGSHYREAATIKPNGTKHRCPLLVALGFEHTLGVLPNCVRLPTNASAGGKARVFVPLGLLDVSILQAMFRPKHVHGLEREPSHCRHSVHE